MKDELPQDGDHKRQELKRSPEVQRKIDYLHRNMGQVLCGNLNRAVLARTQPDLKLIAKEPGKPREHETLEDMLEELDAEMKESVPHQFRQTEKSLSPPKLKIVSRD